MPRKPKAALSEPAFTAESVPLDDLYEDPANARLHNESNLNAICASLREYGQVEPLVVQASTGKVIGGNGRLRAMRALGWTHATVAKVDLDDLKCAGLGITLNRTAEKAEWDYETLGTIVNQLKNAEVDLNALGWSDDDLAPILAADWTPSNTDDLDDHSRETAKDEPHDDGMKNIRVPPSVYEDFMSLVEDHRAAKQRDDITAADVLALLCYTFRKADAA